MAIKPTISKLHIKNGLNGSSETPYNTDSNDIRRPKSRHCFCCEYYAKLPALPTVSNSTPRRTQSKRGSANCPSHGGEKASQTTRSCELPEIGSIGGNSMLQKRDTHFSQNAAYKPRKNKFKANIETHYESCLPKNTWMKMRKSKFAQNHKLGEAFQVRRRKASGKSAKPKKVENQNLSLEEDFRIWLLNRAKYSSVRVVVAKDGPYIYSEENSDGRHHVDKIGSHKDLYDAFHSERLLSNSKKQAAILIQRHVRGWLVRQSMATLQKEALSTQGKPLSHFAKEYKGLMNRLQKRAGNNQPTTEFNMDQVKGYMAQRIRYERAFNKTADGNILSRDALLDFFHKCGLQPSEREIETACKNIFKGCGTSAEIVLILDCDPNMSDKEKRLQTRFVKQLINTLQIGRENVRMALVTYNATRVENFGLDSFSNRDNLLEAINTINIASGDQNLCAALTHAQHVLEKAREGVPRTCILLAHAQTCLDDGIQNEADNVKEGGIWLIPVVIGANGDQRYDYTTIASSPDHVFNLSEFYTLAVLTNKIADIVCTAKCSFCLNHLPSEDPFHFQSYDAETKQICDVTEDSFDTGTRSSQRRGLLKHEAMELLWTIYPPEATGLNLNHTSSWLRPCVDGEEYSVVPATSVEAKFDQCLQLVLKTKLERQGVLLMPVGQYDVAEVRNYDVAYAHARAFMQQRQLAENRNYNENALKQQGVDAFKASYAEGLKRIGGRKRSQKNSQKCH